MGGDNFPDRTDNMSFAFDLHGGGGACGGLALGTSPSRWRSALSSLRMLVERARFGIA
jgi:hypothetical protein